MVSKLLTILFILPIIYAKIEIEISATDEKERDVRISGRQVGLISDIERETFELTEENLKKSISSYFGWTPDNVYLRHPTPWGGLYKSFRWEPVKKVFLPKKATILTVETKSILINSKNLVNEGTEPKIVNEKNHYSVEDTVSSKWDKIDDLEGEDIKYHLDMKTPEDSNFIEFTAKLGEDVVKTMPIDVDSDFQFTMMPKQKVKVELFGTKEIMKIRVDYETSFVGSVAISYDKEYKGHRFWAMDINTVLGAGGLKTHVPSSEVIDVVYFKDAKVVVTDVDTGDVIFTTPLQMH